MERGEQQRERNPISWAGFDGSRQLRNPISRLAAGTDRMDSELWISRLAAAKRHFAVHHSQNSHLDQLSGDVFEAEDEEGQGRQDLPCPYCYEDHDVGSLCYHLEDEHGFESRVARRRRLRRVPIPNSQTLSLLGRDLREAQLQVLLGSGGYRSSNTNASTALTESLLSSLVLNFPTSEADEVAKSSVSSTEDIINKKSTANKSWRSSSDLFLTYEEREQKRRQATVRATFVQDLLLSTLFVEIN